MNFKLKIFMVAMLLVNIQLFAQDTYDLSGTVTDANNVPIPGANILVANTTRGTQSDFDGNFTIQVASGDIVRISYIGYSTQNVAIVAQKTVTVTLTEDASQLDEVVVVGYGTQKKSTITGSISKVTNETLDQIAVSRVDDALIGQVSGVNIQATNAEAGGAPTITIRGIGSVTADSGPALVIDGVVVSSDFLGNLDMNDVESFEVLKDAASAAIYGSEGSNGVILITTKSGKAGKTKFSYQTYTGIKSAHGSDDYRKSVADWAAIELDATGTLSNETQYAQLLVKATGVDRDWQDVFFDGGTITSHSLSARGGSEDTKFSTSLRYLHDEGVVITDDYKLFSANMKVDSKIGEKARFGIRATPSYTKQRRLPTSIHNPTRQSPWLPIYHTEESLQFINRDVYPDVGVGDYFYENHLVELDVNGDGNDSRPRTSGDSNPYAQYVEREHFEYNTKLFGSTYLSYELLDGLTAKTSLGVTLEQRKRTRYDGVLNHASGNSRAAYYLANRFRTRVISDNTLNYTKTFNDDHDLNLLLGATIQKRTSEESITTGSGFSNDLLKNFQGATLVDLPTEINTELRKLGYFARVNYAYKGKYLVNASFRRDGSSVFGIDSKWGNFPAVSLGWNVAKENFLLDSDAVNTLKFRASYGLTGAENFNVGDDIVNAWPYLALLQNSNSIDNGSIAAGVSPLNIANTLLQWEASKELTIGLDYGFFGNVVSGSIDYYKRTSDELLLNNPVSYISGFNSGIVNLGEVENRGFELELRTRNVSNEKFSWNSTIIASTNANELLSFGDSNNALIEDDYGRNSQWINRIGEPISSFWGYVVDEEAFDETSFRTTYVDSPWNRINGQSDDTIVKDLNGDGLITEEDKTILGSPYPDLVYSFTNEFKIGDFDFSFMVQGSLGAQVNNIGDQYFYNWFGNRTRSGGELEAVANGLVSDVSFIQEKVLTSDVIASADYFSLRNVNLGYNLPNDVTDRIGVAGLRVYATAQNLLYITADDYHGFNPEHIDGSNPRAYGSQRAGTPIFRTVTFGLNVDF
ncbi:MULTISPECIES: SusC/RagA family TonB-linked outer membrane protein [Maribacter]|uniref:TonB-linked outer membrane protein, SusC/RagA family n=1 Tax=Maribacter stanieri TaxID=440514 RepID=A0A1I6K9B4_9FLAO|nr:MULTISPECIES: TonB-dependent receptor [Maribacter]SFR87809.1 TonB-linked outer membrane protein, SusC/RagA family [Maribacter stanieri]|tara:strand:+ start:814 stop:3918 length:3105 start_codon:yes stop_codon:yes gene_type:complete